MTQKNPLLQPFSGRYEEIPFSQIRIEHYLPAVDEGLKLAKSRIEALQKAKGAATFENTCEALEACSDELDRAAGVYFNLYSAEATDEFQALAPEISPKLASFSNDIYLDPALFQRIKDVWEN